MMGTILVFLWDKGINRGFLKEFKNKKLGINVKSDWVVKRGQEKKNHGKSLFSLFVSVIVFAISCFFSRNGS